MTTPNTEITSNPPPTVGITADGVRPPSGIDLDIDSLRSIDVYAAPSRWECIGLWCLVLASPITLAVCFLFSTGRDLMLPFLIAQVLVLLVALGLAAVGLRRCDGRRYGVGVLGGIIALGVGALGMLEWPANVIKEYTICITAHDEVTGKAVPNARVTLFHLEDRTFRATSETDKDGRCEIPFVFSGGGRASLVCHTGHVAIGSTAIEIEADGYVPTEIRLGTLLANTWSIHDPPPPPIEIRLSPRK